MLNPQNVNKKPNKGGRFNGATAPPLQTHLENVLIVIEAVALYVDKERWLCLQN